MWRADSLEKTLMLGKIEGRRERGQQRMWWLDSITDLVDMNLSKLREIVKDRKVWHAAVHGVTKSWTWLRGWTTTTIVCQCCSVEYLLLNRQKRSLIDFNIYLTAIHINTCTVCVHRCVWLFKKVVVVKSWCVRAKSFQSCPTLCYPVDYSPPGSTVYVSLQARILEWVALPSSRGSSWPRDQTPVSCIGRWVLYHYHHREAQKLDIKCFVVILNNF